MKLLEPPIGDVRKPKRKPPARQKFNKICGECNLPYIGNGQQKYCSDMCRSKQSRNKAFIDNEEVTRSTRGAVTELLVAAKLMTKGWHVFRSISQHCPCDLVAVKGTDCLMLEVRTGSYYKQTGNHNFSKRSSDVCHIYVMTSGVPGD
jgi:hypothetical protein